MSFRKIVWRIIYLSPPKNSITKTNLNHTGVYLYAKGKIMIHLSLDYKSDSDCSTPSEYLRYHRTMRGLSTSTKELAEKVGIVPATLAIYEKDNNPPDKIRYGGCIGGGIGN
jgi:hypothetical protein